LPAIPIALLLPFVPESKLWQEKRRAGTLRRPSMGELFSPELRRTTLVTAALSACAYGVAFGALQFTPTRIVPGLPDLAEQQQQLRPLQDEAAQLNKQLNELVPAFRSACAAVPGLRELAGLRAKARLALRSTAKTATDPATAAAARAAAESKLVGLTNQLKQ